MKIKKNVLFIALLLGITFNNFAQIENSKFTFIKKINLEGPTTWWDYLTMDGDRLFVSNDDRVHVVNIKTDASIGVITGLKGVHGIALAKEFGKGYITNGTDSTVTVFDYNTLKVLKTIQITGKKANSILFDKVTGRVFVFCSGANYVYVIDAKTDAILKKFEVGEASEFPATNGKGLIYDNIEGSNEIVVIDTKAMDVIKRFSLSPYEGPTSLAMDVASNRLFSVCRKSEMMVAVDAKNGKIVDAQPIGAGVDGVTYDPDIHLVISANGEGTATIIHQDSADKYSVVQTLTTAPGLRTIARNATNHRIYISGLARETDGKTPIQNSFGVYVYGVK